MFVSSFINVFETNLYLTKRQSGNEQSFLYFNYGQGFEIKKFQDNILDVNIVTTNDATMASYDFHQLQKLLSKITDRYSVNAARFEETTNFHTHCYVKPDAKDTTRVEPEVVHGHER